MIPAKGLKPMLEEPVKCRIHMCINMITITLKGVVHPGLCYRPDTAKCQRQWIKIVMLRVGSPIPSKNPSMVKVKNSSHGRSPTVHVGSRNLHSLQTTRKGSSQSKSRIGAHQLCFKLVKGRGQTAVLFQLSKIVTSYS